LKLTYKKTKNSDEKSRLEHKIHSSVTTPHKKKTQENIRHNYETVFNSPSRTGTSTPQEWKCLKTVRKRKRTDYKFIHQIGSGGFGRVWKVESKKDGGIFAMK